MNRARTLAITLALALSLAATAAWANPPACNRVDVFTRPGCPHCAEAKGFLDTLASQQPDLQIRYFDVAADPGQRRRLGRLASQHGVTTLGVPAFLICERFLVGFDRPATTGAEIRALLGGTSPAGAPVRLPLLGAIGVDDVGLPAFTIAIGLLDGINPCAMWVLLILLSVLVGIRDRRKVVLVAGTFVVVSGLAYFAFMAAWLNLFLLIGYSRVTQILLAAVAVIVGLVHLKDLVAFRRGPSLSIPETAKPGIYRRMRAIARADSLAAALLGALALAVLVNGVELLCTAGLPALYTQILTLQALAAWQHYAYLALYNLAYVTDDALMVTLAVVTLNRMKLQEAQGRWLKGVAGAVMLALGLVLLLRPEWLSA